MNPAILPKRFEFIQKIRDFFLERSFVDVMVPPVVENPGMETHIHPFKIQSAHGLKSHELYLHTSPEFKLKELLSHYEQTQLDKVFCLSYCFRDEPVSPIHRPQFLMLEWYRLFESYETIQKDLEELTNFLTDKKNTFTVKTIQEIILEIENFDILNLLKFRDLKTFLKSNYKELEISEEIQYWDDLYWLFFLNYIEPHLKNYPYLFLKEFPAPLAALSKLKEKDPRACERFEFYIDGIEIANCFHEVTDLNEQKARFEKQTQEKKEIYGYTLPEPKAFYQSLERGLPSCSGIALGVERLMSTILEKTTFFD